MLPPYSHLTLPLYTQFFADIVFSVFYMTVFDYLIAAFSCDFSEGMEAHHLYFPGEQKCK